MACRDCIGFNFPFECEHEKADRERLERDSRVARGAVARALEELRDYASQLVAEVFEEGEPHEWGQVVTMLREEIARQLAAMQDGKEDQEP